MSEWSEGIITHVCKHTHTHTHTHLPFSPIEVLNSNIQPSYSLGLELLWVGGAHRGREGVRDKETETIKYWPSDFQPP